MNRFEKFLEESSIAFGSRHSASERASYFVWYHIHATGQPDADLELVAEYFKESRNPVPELYQLYRDLSTERGLVIGATFPGRFRMGSPRFLEEHEGPVFNAKGLAPLYFERTAAGKIIRIGSWTDLLKYWPQRHWAAAWIAFLVAILGTALALFALPFIAKFIERII